ncbi:MAG: flagellar biosynthesis/type III secretory pathway chaperone [Arenicella sp.]|jgi:flagellar biosynthesis/type III secretory pathway chaperone
MQQAQLLSQAVKNASSLKLLLDQEFDALRVQDLSVFESLQNKKIEILALLTNDDVAAHLKSYIDSAASPTPQSAGWDQVISVLEECKGRHFRNQILIDSKLESIRGALRTLQSSDQVNDVEIYDRLGKMKGRRGLKRLSLV